MRLLNHTSRVDADKTAAEIARCLSMHGAQAVLTEYDQKSGAVTSLSFKIKVEEQTISFRLPCDPEPVYQILIKGKKKPSNWATGNRGLAHWESEHRAQAIRTAWRIVKDWVEAQMALVETRMVTTAQVFLPYALTSNGQTLAERIAENPTMLLGPGQ